MNSDKTVGIRWYSDKTIVVPTHFPYSMWVQVILNRVSLPPLQHSYTMPVVLNREHRCNPRLYRLSRHCAINLLHIKTVISVVHLLWGKLKLQKTCFYCNRVNTPTDYFLYGSFFLTIATSRILVSSACNPSTHHVPELVFHASFLLNPNFSSICFFFSCVGEFGQLFVYASLHPFSVDFSLWHPMLSSTPILIPIRLNWQYHQYFTQWFCLKL